MKFITSTMRNPAGLIAEAMEEMHEELEPDAEVESEGKSNSSESEEDTQPEEPTLQFDIELCEFYYQTIVKLIGELNPKNTRPLRRYFNLLRRKTDTWCHFPDKDANDIKDILYYRVAYIYRNSTCISSAVAHHFKTVLNDNANILQSLIQKKVLRICSVGGGSPSDIVALIKVLESKIECKSDLDIHITIIDKDSNWKNTCFTVLRSLERFSNAICKIDFIEADLTTSPFPSNVDGAIKNADLVSMVKFLSEVTCRKDKFTIVTNLFQLVQPGSIIFALDHPQNEIIEACGHFTGVHTAASMVHQDIYGMHALEEETVAKQFHMYSEHFGDHGSNTSLNVFVRVWLKLKPGGCWSPQGRLINERIEEMREKFNKDRLDLQVSMTKLRSERNSISLKRLQNQWINSFTEEKKLAGWSKKKIKEALSVVENPITPEVVADKVQALDCSLKDLKTSLTKLKADEADSIVKLKREDKEKRENNKRHLNEYLKNQKEIVGVKRKAHSQSVCELLIRLKETGHNPKRSKIC